MKKTFLNLGLFLTVGFTIVVFSFCNKNNDKEYNEESMNKLAEKEIGIYIPCYFTPNGDGIHDSWEIGNIKENYPSADIKIYDLSGKLLTQYSGNEVGWNGTYKEKEMPNAYYKYLITIDEIGKQYKGYFILCKGNVKKKDYKPNIKLSCIDHVGDPLTGNCDCPCYFFE